jgi:S1-C subfamily serine protease
MDSHDIDIDVEPEPEEPTRPAWLLADPTEVIDEPRIGSPYEPPPSMVTPPAEPPPAEHVVTPAPKGPSTRRAALVGALAGAIVAAAVSFGVVSLTDDDPSSAARTVAPVAVANGQGLDVHAVLSAVQDAVVAINVEGISSQFGGMIRGAGSGMVIEDDGLILTNNHVVDGATSITVTLADGRDVDADLVGSIPSNDVALVKARGVTHASTVTFGSSSDLRVGDPVVAIGNALGLGGTPSVTAGIVSALGRELDAENGEHLTDLIQTDTAIYQGNSGGPLVNAQGEVVGVNTAVATSQANGAAENLGFALPIDQLKPLIDELKKGGGDVVAGAFLGVRTVDLNDVQPAILDRFGVKTDSGAFVGEVVPGSAAEEAGLQPGDVIVEIDGKRVKEAVDVGDIIAGHEPGDEVKLRVERNGKERTLTATLGSRGVTR